MLPPHGAWVIEATKTAGALPGEWKQSRRPRRRWGWDGIQRDSEELAEGRRGKVKDRETPVLFTDHKSIIRIRTQAHPDTGKAEVNNGFAAAVAK